MPLPRHPFRPLQHALQSVLEQAGDARTWWPFALVGLLKAIGILALVRLDLVPAHVLAPLLAALPAAESSLHYPDVPERLPTLLVWVDLGVFLTVGAVLQGWAIARLTRAWTGDDHRLCPDVRRGVRRIVRLCTLAGILAVVPLGTLQAAGLLDHGVVASMVALVAGIVVEMLLLAAPAFVVLHDLSLRSSIAASIRLLTRLPVALPLAVLVLSALHAPGFALRDPAIRAGMLRDPDWIALALVGQIPADACGAFLAAGLSAYFASRTRVRGGTLPGAPRHAVLATLAVLVLVAGSGCDLERARDVSRRYACERWVERAGLRHAELRGQGVTDSTAWSAVAALYGRAVARLDAGLMERDGADALRHDLGRLACRARLGRADAQARSGLHEPAVRGFAEVLERAVSFDGARADAALGLAQAEDRAGHWNEAHAAYSRWLEGVRDGTWPLHRQGMDVPVYVSRRLRDRNARQARLEWVELAARAFDAAASRGELPRPARYTRFVVLLEAERWDEAYAALRRCRELHDPDGEDGGLVVAEASLLAGGLGRQRDALRLLAGLDAERSGFASQHRVAGWLLAAQIQARAGDLRAARRDYEKAAAEARSAAGRSEATLGLARIHTELGELDQARRYYSQLRQVWFATPAGLLAPVEEVRMLWRYSSEAQARALLPVAMQHYRRMIQQFGTEMPAMLAAQYLSECMGLAGSWERGIAFLDSIAREFERDPRSGSLLVRAARLAAEKLSDGERAEALLAQLYERYPDSDVAVLARTLEDSLSHRAPSP